MWKVIVTLKGRDGNLTPMTYLLSGDKWQAVQNVMAALDTDENDPEWVTVHSIKITKI